MIFLNPVAFWGLMLLLVPIVVHFFDLRQVKKVRFSNVSVLKAIISEGSAKSRLKELLLLIARCSAIVFLVLVFAQPFLPKDDGANSFDETILLDNSFSMGGNCDGLHCLERAKELLIEINDVPRETNLFYAGLRYPKSYLDRDEFKAILGQVGFSKSFWESKFRGDLNSRFIILSDFQEQVIQYIKSELTDSAEFILLPISNFGGYNLSVDTVYLLDRFALGGSKQSLGVRLFNSGKEKIENTLVRLLNGNNQISSVAVDIDANASVEIKFEVELSYVPTFEIRLDDPFFDLDNSFYFNVPRIDKLTICTVGGSINRNLDAVFRNDSYFNLYAYDEQSVDFDRVFNADLVIFHSFDQLPDWADFERMKGSVVVIPGSSIDLSNYSSILGLGVRKSLDSTRREFQVESLRHPFYEGVFDKLDERSTLPEVRTLYQVSGVNETLLSSTAPYLQKLAISGCEIYFFGSPLSEPYSSLQNHSLFLPLMYRIAEHSIDLDRPLYHRLTDRPIDLRGIEPSSALVKMNGAAGEFVPEIYRNQTDIALTLPTDLNAPGHYYLLASDDTLDIMALNIPIQESRFTLPSSDDLREIFSNNPNVTVLDTESAEALKASLKEMKDGVPIWKYALLLALMFLVAEIAIHRWLK